MSEHHGIKTTIGYTTGRGSGDGYYTGPPVVMLYVNAQFEGLSASGPPIDIQGIGVDQLADALRENKAAAIAALRATVEARAVQARADMERLARWLDGAGPTPTR